MRTLRAQALLMLLGGMSAMPNAMAAVLFEDNFDSGVLSGAWVSVAPSQWIEDGWLHQQDRDGWPRDALVEVHDEDQSWRDYTVHATADFLSGDWEDLSLVLKSNGFYRTSIQSLGSAYQLTFRGSGFGGEPRGVFLTRYDHAADPFHAIELGHADWVAPDGPFDIVADLHGDRIQVTVDGRILIDAVDPNPLPYGGIGFHTIWESYARFDNVRVEGIAASVPEPTSSAIMLTGIVAIGALWRRASVGRLGRAATG